MAVDGMGHVQVPFDMPDDGKASVVISGKDGGRIRELATDVAYTKGRQSIGWDFRDGQGKPVAPGEYTFRITMNRKPLDERAGVSAGNMPFPSLVARPAGGLVAAFSFFSHGGGSVSVMGPAGRILHSHGIDSGFGEHAIANVSTSNALYSVGERWDVAGNGATNVQLQLLGFGWEDGRRVRTSPEGVFFSEPKPLGMTNAALAGAAFAAGKLYVADRIGNCVRAFSLEETPACTSVGSADSVIAASAPGVMAAGEDGTVYLADGTLLVRLDLRTRGRIPLYNMQAVPVSIAVRDGYAYWLPQGGREVLARHLGGWFNFMRPLGAREEGRLALPVSICVTSDSRVWVAEAGVVPKRFTIGSARPGRPFYERLYPECDCPDGLGDSNGSAREMAVTVNVSAAQIENAELRELSGLPQKDDGPKALVIPFQAYVAADGNSLPRLAEWGAGTRRVRIGAAYDSVYLYLRYECGDPSPWVNKGKDWKTLSKTGDAVELQIGEIRVVYAPSGSPDGNIAVRYRGHAEDAAQLPLPEWAKARVETGRYTVCLAVPLAELGLEAAKVPGQSYPADFGVFFGDHDGTESLLSLRWAKRALNGASGTVTFK
jgi:hypothetical protein